MESYTESKQTTVKEAASALKAGQLVVFPTETVYGLGANATDQNAVARIYAVKNRPISHPLIVHISSVKYLKNWALEIPDYAIKLSNEFWPGPMTLIFRKTDLAKNFLTGSQSSVGIRIPGHSTALELLSEFEKLGGLGVAAPSANKFKAVSPTTVQAALEEIGENLQLNDRVLNGGVCSIGIESTIINCTGKTPELLRPGAITEEMITQLTGLNVVKLTGNSRIKAPGVFKSHYSPKAKVFLNSEASSGDGFLALSKFHTPIGSIRIGAPDTIENYAKELYSALRLADQKGLRKIVVIPPEGMGLAAAIRDRLQKAAFKK